MSPCHRKKGFTLVELLVVIGIIALLISILLPALSAARRQAGSVKCMSALRQLGNSWRMYAEENRGYACPLRVGGQGTNVANGKPYSLYGILYGCTPVGPAIAGVQTTEAAWWMNFLAKYLSATKGGAGDMTTNSTELDRNTVIWGCPAWQGYPETRAAIIALGGITEHHYTGYSLNYEPTYTASNPAIGADFPPDVEAIDIVLTDNIATIDRTMGTWWKSNKYTNPASRAIFGDCYAISLEAKSPPPTVGTFPGQEILGTTSYTSGVSGQTTFDFYRHGKYPALVGNQYQTNGGKVSFNICYADGHVANSTDRADAYRAIRMRYPQ